MAIPANNRLPGLDPPRFAPPRRIAAHLLLTAAGERVRRPLVEFAPDGRIRSVAQWRDVDREPFTVFYAGLLVPDFPTDYRAAFAAVAADRTTPLDRLLPRTPQGVTVLLTGIDYERLLLTDRTTIRRVMP